MEHRVAELETENSRLKQKLQLANRQLLLVAKRSLCPPAGQKFGTKSEFGLSASDRVEHVSEHVSSVIGRCAQTIHALRILRSQGLCTEATHRVYSSIIIGKLLYAVSSWWGFASAADRQRLQALLKRGIRSGLCSPETPNLTELQNLLMTHYSNSSCTTRTMSCAISFLNGANLYITSDQDNTSR